MRGTLLPFLRLVMGGAMNSRDLRIFGASRLVLIPKAGGSADYRPLGIGSALYHLLKRVVVNQVTGEQKETLVPFELALGVRDAGAALATLAQGIFEPGRKGGLHCTDQLGLDLKNAFGTVSRVRIHEALCEHIAIVALVLDCTRRHNSNSPLYVGVDGQGEFCTLRGG